MKSIDWRSNEIIFKFFLGFDKADELYDIGDAWSEMRDIFKERATFRLVVVTITITQLSFYESFFIYFIIIIIIINTTGCLSS